MTVGIAGFSGSEYIVTVSDARLSQGEYIPAADNGTMKNRKIAPKWGMMFAATDSSAFVPVISATHRALNYTAGETDTNPDLTQVGNAVREAYEKEVEERFFRQHVSKLRYADIAEFRKEGFSELGKEWYDRIIRELYTFDLGLELLVYGFESKGTAHIFEVANPGKLTSHNLRGFAAIGSGSLMAFAALNRKHIPPTLSDTVWRLLDAKFSSETAPNVSKKTHVIIMNKLGKIAVLRPHEIEAIREKWEKEELQRPIPDDALDFIENIRAIKLLME